MNQDIQNPNNKGKIKRRLKLVVILLLCGVGLFRVNRAYQNQRLLLAVHSGSLQILNSALRWGAEVNQPQSPIAILGKNIFLSANANGYGAQGRSHIYFRGIRLLLDHGADVNLPDRSGYTVLAYLVQTANLSSVTELVERGANVNGSLGAPGSNNQIPLILAARVRRMNPHRSNYDYDKVIAYLLEQGADVHAKDPDGYTALYYLSGQKRGFVFHPSPIAKLVELGAEINPNWPNRSPLHQAVRHGQPDNVRELLELGADVDAPSPEGYTAAFYAAHTGGPSEAHRVEILRILIDAGANLDLEIPNQPAIRESPLVMLALASAEEEGESRGGL